LGLYFENIFYPLDFSDDEDDLGNQEEKKVKVVKNAMTVNFFGIIDNCVSINMRDVLQKKLILYKKI
jgi:hypothetical protein